MGKPKTDRTAIMQVIRALKKAGWNPTKITDPENVNVEGVTPTEIANLITSHYYSAVLHFKKPEADNFRTQWVYFVLGNLPEEVVCDYTVGNQEFDTIVTELTESWDE